MIYSYYLKEKVIKGGVILYMAVLTDRQIKRRVDKSLQKDETLKRKVEKQKKKEIYSEKWYQDEVKKRAKALEEVAPTEVKEETKVELPKNGMPTFFDNLDINTLFNPINLCKDEDDKKVKIKLEQYVANEKIFEPALVKIDVDCYNSDELKDFYDKIYTEDEDYKKLIDKRKELEERLRENKKKRLVAKKDKETFNIDKIDKDVHQLEREKEILEEQIAEYEEQGITQKDVEQFTENEIPSVNNEGIWKKLGSFRTDFFHMISRYFQRYIPVYDKYTCTCCGKAKTLDDYYINYNVVNASRSDCYGNVRLSICKTCSEKLFNYLFLEKAYKSVEVAMKMFCANLNIYYDNKILVQALRNFEVNEHQYHLIKEYFDLLYINEENIEKSFLDSPFLNGAFSKENGIELKENEDPDEIMKQGQPMTWTREDIRNMKQVKRMIGYDPFGYQTDENRVILYNDLLNMLEAGMENDMVKVQAAIQIVLSYFRIREINEQEFQMRQNNASLADLRALSELKAKELTSISKFSQDNGFSERYATAKAKGENTFTGILKKMDTDKFENAMINRYNIETSTTIAQAADASVAAIFKQLNMSDTDIWKTCQDQLAELLKLRKENAMFAEQLRLMKYELKKAELIKEAKEQGIEIDENISFEEDDEDD